MSKSPAKNLAHSVNARLKSLAKDRGVSFDYLLLRYAIERFLYRLGQSKHFNRFILKGASAFSIWADPMFRVTRDADLYCHGNSDPAFLIECFQEICTQSVPDDGIVFDLKSLASSEIKKEAKYKGTRITFNAHIASARVTLQFDIGFGDAIFPEAELCEYPVLLEFQHPSIRVYSRYTVIAEKFEAMVSLGMLNSRLKDYFDLWLLAEDFDYVYATLRQSLEITFTRRNTPFPHLYPIALSDAFATDAMKNNQWNAFIRKVSPMKYPDSLITAIQKIRLLVQPFIESETSDYSIWRAGKGWEK